MTDNSAAGSGSADNDWCLIESDPAVFTELLETLGVQGVELSEVWSLDDESLLASSKIYGLVFLFQWIRQTQQDHAQSKEPLSEADSPASLFFAHQVTTNACAIGYSSTRLR